MCTLQCILLSCDTVYDSAVFRMTDHDICANSAHDPANSLWMHTTSMREQQMIAHDIYANSPHAKRSSCFVGNGCTSMPKPITT